MSFGQIAGISRHNKQSCSFSEVMFCLEWTWNLIFEIDVPIFAQADQRKDLKRTKAAKAALERWAVSWC